MPLGPLSLPPHLIPRIINETRHKMHLSIDESHVDSFTSFDLTFTCVIYLVKYAYFFLEMNNFTYKIKEI